MNEIILRPTNAPPRSVNRELDDHRIETIGYRHLFTDTGKATRWNVALWLFVDIGKEPPKSIKVQMKTGR